MKKTNKKGFTIVELVIVIAVIAILAAVLIPTFSNVINKANQAKDTQLVRNLNTSLALDVGVKHNTMQDAIDAVAEQGYDLDKINASAMQSEILWDSHNDAFVYLDSEGKINYLPEITKDREAYPVELWQICKEMPIEQTYSIYAGNSWNTANVNGLKVGFDAGKNTNIASVNYVNNGSAQSVFIRTNGGKLAINDTSTDGKVYHYGYAGLINVLACADHSYYEYGTTNILDVTDGHVVLTKDAVVNKEVHFSLREGETAYLGDIILTVETDKMPAFTRDSLGTNDILEQLVCEVKDSSSSEYIWVKATGIESEFVVTNNNSAPTETNTITASSKVCELVSDIANIKNGEGPVEDTGLTAEQKAANNEAAENGKFVKITGASDEKYNGLSSIEEMSYIINGGTFNDKIYAANSNAYVGATIELLCDMNLKDTTWVPFGMTDSIKFGGCKLFDGHGYTISGITYKASQQYYSGSNTLIAPNGLIGYLGGDITFKNLTVDVNIFSETTGGFGAFIGQAKGSYRVIFENCTAKGIIEGTDKLGGFIGDLSSNQIDNTEEFVTTFINCTNEVNVTAKSAVDGKNSRAAGFVGSAACRGKSLDSSWNYNALKLIGCTNKGDIYNKSATADQVAAAGFLGQINSYGAKTVLVDCVNTGKIKCDNYVKITKNVSGYTSDSKVYTAYNFVAINNNQSNCDMLEGELLTINGKVIKMIANSVNGSCTSFIEEN